MHTVQFTSPFQLRWFLAMLCITLSLGTMSYAAEVRPIAVDVVGEPGSQVPVAPETPDVQSLSEHELNMRHARELANMGSHLDDMHSSYTRPILGDVLVPVLAISLIFGGPIVLVIFLVLMRSRSRARRQKMQSENIARLIEAGRDVPLELLLGADAPAQKAENNLRKGIENVCVGIALLIFLTLMVGVEIGAVGFIVIAYGVSQLAVWKLIDSKAAPTTSTDTAKQD